MLNAERFKEEINKHNNEFGLADNIVDCGTLGCRNCRFSRLNNSDDVIIMCSTRKVKWLLSEYKEPIKVSKLEYDILKFAFKNGYCYITRTESGHVEVHKEKPLMRSNEIFGHHWGNRGKSIYLFDNIFCFVKWVGSEKSKPMLIKEILDECEVIKNEND